jgi:hypothetical protein
MTNSVNGHWHFLSGGWTLATGVCFELLLPEFLFSFALSYFGFFRGILFVTKRC